MTPKKKKGISGAFVMSMSTSTSADFCFSLI